MRFLLTLCAVSVSLVFFDFLYACNPVAAQSIDQTKPTLLTDNNIEGSDELRGQTYYYAFTVNPGDVFISAKCSTDFDVATIHVVFSGESEAELADVAITGNPAGGGARFANFHIPRKQRVIMRVGLPLSGGVHVNYHIHLSGSAISLGAGGAASAEPATDDDAKSALKPTETAATDPHASTSQNTQNKTASALEKASSAAADTPIDDKWALIVGVSKFHKPELNLKYPAKDATDLRDYLVKEAHFAPDHVKLLVDEQATKEHVLAELGDKWLPRLAHPNDLVLIFISTHGSPTQMDLEGLNYLVMNNTDPDSLYATGLPLQDLAATIKQRVHSNRVILIVDACHSGSANPAKGISRAGNFDSNTLVQGTGQLVVCSSQPNQVSWESKRYENGVFTRQLIEALRSNSGKNTFLNVFDRLKESVQNEVLQDRSELQVPVLKSIWNGNSLMLTAPPAKPRSIPPDFNDR